MRDDIWDSLGSVGDVVHELPLRLSRLHAEGVDGGRQPVNSGQGPSELISH
jgi:hypothetical protein